MKYGKQIFVILCMLLLACGCQEVPEGVKENMERYGDNSQLEPSELEYCSIEELGAAEIPDIDTGSLKLPSDVDFSGIEEVGLLHLSCCNDFQKDSNVEKYASLFGMDKGSFVKQETTVLGEEVHCEDEKEREYLSLAQNGGLAYLNGLAFEDSPNTAEKAYNLAKDDISGVTVKLTDGEISLSDMCRSAEDWLNENMQIEGVHQEITDVLVRRLEDAEGDAKRVSMCAEYDYKGIHFNNHTLGRIEEEDFQNKAVTTFLFTQLAFDASDMPSFLSRNEAFQIEKAEPLDQVVSFESAVRMLSETLSGFGEFEISEVLPLYDIYPNFEEEPVGRGMEARPVYAFLVETAEKGDGTALGIVKPNRCKYFFFVDMATGELTTNLKIEQEE